MYAVNDNVVERVGDLMLLKNFTGAGSFLPFI